MGIYIKGMKMPKNCAECELGDIVCEFDEDHAYIDCPLIGVSEPHGRLIDADKLLKNLPVEYLGSYYHLLINDAPTVIEREVAE